MKVQRKKTTPCRFSEWVVFNRLSPIACLVALGLHLSATPGLAGAIRTARYEGKPIRIRLAEGLATSIALPEAPEAVAAGDQGRVQVQVTGNLILVKPLRKDSVTNLIVSTSRRAYAFALEAGPRDEADYMVTVEDHVPTVPALALRSPARGAAIRTQLLRALVSGIAPPGMRGARLATPEPVYDDPVIAIALVAGVEEPSLGISGFSLKVTNKTPDHLLLEEQAFSSPDLAGIMLASRTIPPEGETMLYLLSTTNPIRVDISQRGRRPGSFVVVDLKSGRRPPGRNSER